MVSTAAASVTVDDDELVVDVVTSAALELDSTEAGVEVTAVEAGSDEVAAADLDSVNDADDETEVEVEVTLVELVEVTSTLVDVSTFEVETEEVVAATDELVEVVDVALTVVDVSADDATEDDVEVDESDEDEEAEVEPGSRPSEIVLFNAAGSAMPPTPLFVLTSKGQVQQVPLLPIIVLPLDKPSVRRSARMRDSQDSLYGNEKRERQREPCGSPPTHGAGIARG